MCTADRVLSTTVTDVEISDSTQFIKARQLHILSGAGTVALVPWEDTCWNFPLTGCINATHPRFIRKGSAILRKINFKTADVYPSQKMQWPFSA